MVPPAMVLYPMLPLGQRLAQGGPRMEGGQGALHPRPDAQKRLYSSEGPGPEAQGRPCFAREPHVLLSAGGPFFSCT